ncbi:hypothetical protein PLICRDRAFT_463331 [Plicaturopsis crispa FD-325 SS-3]|nr:hypothetical protein PLICRDRAFT_463331 [Plicaturopsis crispa FD-325 SS-3]
MSSSQTIHPDYEIYAEQMALLMHGTALWEPSPIRHRYDCVRLGDVGYIAEGQFCLLFHAAEPLGSRVLGEDVPLEFEPLDYGSVKQLQPRLPRPLYTQTVHNKGLLCKQAPLSNSI